LSSGRIFLDTFKSLGTFTLGLIVALAGANSLSDLLLKFFSNTLTLMELKTIVFAVISFLLLVPYVYLFWDSTFAAKRVIFMGIGSEISEKHNVYMFENEMFKLLGRGKSKEFPVDYFSQAVFQLGSIAFFWWLQVEFEKAVSGPNVIVLPWFSCFSVIIVLLLILDVLIPWQKRHLQGYM
jgi:hypothetical protein